MQPPNNLTLQPNGALDLSMGRMQVIVHSDPATALGAWGQLEALAPHSMYQTRRWMLPWLATLGVERRIHPMLIVVLDARMQPVLLLLLGIERRNGMKIAGFLGGKDSNFNMALCRPGTLFSAEDLRAILVAAARLSPLRPDLYVLANQPDTWEGRANLFAALPCQPSPSFASKTALALDWDAFLRGRLSKDTRRKLLKKERKLAEIGPVIYVHGAPPTKVPEIIAAFHLQQSARLKAMGLADVYASDAARRFLLQASTLQSGQDRPALEWHALMCGLRVVATFAGGVCGDRFHGMVTSFDGAADVAASSPGDLLINRIVADCCRRGIASLDLGIGEARYKSTYCDIVEPLFDSLIAISLQGRLWARAEALRLAAKRAIKQSPLAWSLVRALRARR